MQKPCLSYRKVVYLFFFAISGKVDYWNVEKFNFVLYSSKTDPKFCTFGRRFCDKRFPEIFRQQKIRVNNTLLSRYRSHYATDSDYMEVG